MIWIKKYPLRAKEMAIKGFYYISKRGKDKYVSELENIIN
jgi:hypothetical protein